MEKVNIFWFRRDLRLTDNSGLFYALKSNTPVVPLFIFDTDILDKLENKADRRVEFIYTALQEMKATLEKIGVAMEVHHGKPLEVFQKLLQKYSIQSVYTNNDYEGYAIERDQSIYTLLKLNHIGFKTFKDHVIFEKAEVVKDDGKPYAVFSPYSRKWLGRLKESDLAAFPSENMENFYRQPPLPFPSLAELGFTHTGASFPSREPDELLIQHYKAQRDIPGIAGTSRLGVHLRFGTISIRAIARYAQKLSSTFLNELIWRDFYQMITWNYPHINKGLSFKPAYDHIPWRNNESEFALWCNGQTGYPIVDAGMRELHTTGFMHNRIRMVTASFLCKHLLIDWRWGEAYFAEKLLDFDFASNNGGWQWASGSGCDAAPYFRIFNPYLQTKKFDPDFSYIKKWVPEFQEFTYPAPIIAHEDARKRCLMIYSAALQQRL